MEKDSIKGAFHIILLGALAPLTLILIMFLSFVYLSIISPKGMANVEFSDFKHHGIFVIFGIQSLLYCACAALIGKRGPIAGIVLSSAAFIGWGVFTNAGAPGDSFIGSLFNFALLGAAFSFSAAMIAEYTVLLMTRIGLAVSADPEVERLSYWRRKFKARAKS